MWLNDTQYFGNIPVDAFEMRIGAFQPAEKWLKDRRGRKLGYDDIVHYQKIIASLEYTSTLMDELDLLWDKFSA